MNTDAVFVAGFVTVLVIAGTWACAYQLGRMSAFREALEKFDAAIGPLGCHCSHERELPRPPPEGSDARMSTAVVIVLVLLVLFVFVALLMGAAVLVNLARLQAAVMKHRDAPWRTEENDEELYRAAGFEPGPAVQMRFGPGHPGNGERIR